MILDDLFEAQQPRVIVTYPGRFQPFHLGHQEVYKILEKTFGADKVYILTSDKTDAKKSPFNFQDKLTLISAAGIPANRVIETSNMYSLPEEFDPRTTIFITAVGSPDADRLKPDSLTAKDNTDRFGIFKPAGSPSYYKMWTGKNVVTADKHGYVKIIPEIIKSVELKGKNYDVSHGTDCRNLWNAIRKDKGLRHSFLKQLYGTLDPNIERIFDKIPYTPSQTEDVSPMGTSTVSPISGNIQEEAAGVGVIANARQRNDKRYKTSITQDVKPGAIQKALRGFRLAEEQQVNLSEKWSKTYKKSIDCSNPKGFSQKAHCAGRKARQQGRKTKSRSINESIDRNNFVDNLGKMLSIAMTELQLNKLPLIKLNKNLQADNGQATFGRYKNQDNVIELALEGRHPIDIFRTLAHELVHYKQNLDNKLDKHSGDTGSAEENEAHAIAGVIMRHFNKKYPEHIKGEPLL